MEGTKPVAPQTGTPRSPDMHHVFTGDAGSGQWRGNLRREPVAMDVQGLRASVGAGCQGRCSRAVGTSRQSPTARGRVPEAIRPPGHARSSPRVTGTSSDTPRIPLLWHWTRVMIPNRGAP